MTHHDLDSHFRSRWSKERRKLEIIQSLIFQAKLFFYALTSAETVFINREHKQKIKNKNYYKAWACDDKTKQKWYDNFQNFFEIKKNFNREKLKNCIS